MSSRATVAVVLAISLPLPIQAHDIYSHLTDEGGGSCCGDRDCQPVPYKFGASGVQMFVNQRWIDVPSARIQYRTLPGDTGETAGGHWCGSVHEGSTDGFDATATVYLTKCAILPPQSASAQ
jgi:hypothetical protein